MIKTLKVFKFVVVCLVLISFGILLVPNRYLGALTPAELADQIRSVQQQIQRVQQQINTSGHLGPKTKEEVIKLQGHLGVAPDGYYGPKTKTAVANWQKAHGVPPPNVPSFKLTPGIAAGPCDGKDIAVFINNGYQPGDRGYVDVDGDDTYSNTWTISCDLVTGDLTDQDGNTAPASYWVYDQKGKKIVCTKDPGDATPPTFNFPDGGVFLPTGSTVEIKVFAEVDDCYNTPDCATDTSRGQTNLYTTRLGADTGDTTTVPPEGW